MSVQLEDFQLNQKCYVKYTLKTGAKINIYQDGPENGAKFLLFHGAQSFIEMLAPFINKLSKNHRVLAIDLPGHGDSDQFPSYSDDVFQDAVVEVLEQLNFTNYYLIGHSLGGYLAVKSYTSPKFAKFNQRGVIAFCPSGLTTKLAKTTPITPQIESYLLKDFKQSLTSMYTPKQPDPHLPPWLSSHLVSMLIDQLSKNAQKSLSILRYFSGFDFNGSFDVFKAANSQNVTIVFAENDKTINSEESASFLTQNCKEMNVLKVKGTHEILMAEPEFCCQIVAKCCKQ
ncbi:Alpha/beta_hydrolase family protein [Hexamita inflata]|uniref:Alpha/beta hydrolase family protein n=1 Tax=Hexamita inflata TaxID=28002 RepID=A0AA86R3F5_9EUKA|nr:Alpha/beta hydrolase family protein [Hexamita inflata]